MTHSQHITGERLLDLAESRLATEEADALNDHLRSCAACAARWDEVRSAHADLMSAHLPDAPAAWIRRAQNRESRSRAASPPAPWIAFDSLVDALPGFRGAESGRQYLVEAGDVDIEVAIASDTPGEPWPVTGQLVSRVRAEPIDAEITMIVEGRAMETVRASAWGEFQFTVRPRGVFRLRLGGPLASLETPDLAP